MNPDSLQAMESAAAIRDFTNWLAGAMVLGAAEHGPSKLLLVDIRIKKTDLFAKIFGRKPTTMEQDHLGTSV